MSKWKETDIGPIPADWDVITVADAIQDKGIAVGVMYPGEDTVGGIPMIRVADIKGGKINSSTGYHISPSVNEQHKRTILNGGEVIVTLVGNPGTTVVVRDEFKGWNVARAIGVMKLKDPSEGKYLSYALHSPNSKFLIDSFLNTTVQPTLNLGELKLVQIPWPNKSIRISIAEALSSIDDKIDLLHRNNKTLEQLAETLFRQWFEKVENEESTTIKNIEEVATVQNGYSFKSSEFITEQPDTLEVLKMGHISAEGGLRPSPKKDFIKRDEKYNKWILNKRDIILAMTDMKDNVVILGVPALIDQDNKYVLNQRVGRISINDGSLIENILILYMQMKDKNFISELQSKGNSGVQVNLGTDTIRQTKVVVPSKDNQRKILPQLESIFDKLDHNRNQVQQLEILRDTLLPKLMSGIVRVEN